MLAKVLLISSSIFLLLPSQTKAIALDCEHDCGPPHVVCYFTNWAWYRSEEGKFLPSNINASLCTHIVYAFAVLNNETLLLESSDTWADIDNSFFKLVTALKELGLIVILSFGGWNDSAYSKYSQLVNDPTARKRFIEHSIGFVQEHGFMGLDCDWEYPKCWQGNCTLGPRSDKENFALFIEELKLAYEEHNLLVSIAISASKRIIDEAYDIPKLSKYCDYIGVMNYDIYTATAGGTLGPNSPYISHYGGPAVIQSMAYLVSLGADSCKLLMGVPLYGRTATLEDSNNHEFGAPVLGPGTAGSYTKEAGFLAFYEICWRIKYEGWSVGHTIENASFAYKGDQFVSYCGLQDILLRTILNAYGRYGGIMIWALDEDDFNNICGCGSYPLLTAINIGLGRLHRSFPFNKPQTCTIDF